MSETSKYNIAKAIKDNTSLIGRFPSGEYRYDERLKSVYETMPIGHFGGAQWATIISGTSNPGTKDGR